MHIQCLVFRLTFMHVFPRLYGIHTFAEGNTNQPHVCVMMTICQYFDIVRREAKAKHKYTICCEVFEATGLWTIDCDCLHVCLCVFRSLFKCIRHQHIHTSLSPLCTKRIFAKPKLTIVCVFLVQLIRRMLDGCMHCECAATHFKVYKFYICWRNESSIYEYRVAGVKNDMFAPINR